MNIIIFGDSITAGYWDTEGGWVGRLKKYTDQITISTNFNTYYSIYNLGISGDTSKGLTNRFENELKRRYDPEDKNTVLIAIGINGSQIELTSGNNEISLSEFEENIMQLITLVKKNNADIFFIGLTPIDQEKVNPMSWRNTHGYQTDQIELYNSSLLKICIENNIPFLNLLNIFQPVDFKPYLIDGVHPNNKGHRLIFEEIEKFLRKLNIIQ